MINTSINRSASGSCGYLSTSTSSGMTRPTELRTQSLSSPGVQFSIGIASTEAMILTKDHVTISLRQNEWQNGNTGAQYRKLQPTLDLTIKFVVKPRLKETTTYRIRLHRANRCMTTCTCATSVENQKTSTTTCSTVHGKLNCDICRVPDDVSHYLLHCLRQAELRHLSSTA